MTSAIRCLGRAGLRVQTERVELGFGFDLLGPERRQRNPEKADAARDREKRFEQGVADLPELIAAADRVVTGAASGDLPEVRELDFERDGAPANAGALAVAPDLVRDLVERLARGLVGVRSAGKVFSAPTDLRMRLATTGRSSMPCEAQ